MEHKYNMKQKQMKRPTAKFLLIRHPDKCPSCNISDDVNFVILEQ